MANSLEKFFLNKLKQMPPVEVQLTNTDKKAPLGSGPGGSKTPVARGKKVTTTIAS